MELLKLVNGFKEVLNIKNVEDAQQRLMAVLFDYKEKDTIVDMCCGSGSLTIQQWNRNKNMSFICKEFDEKVIPFLLFNLSIRNINGEVMQCDVLSGKVTAVYKLKFVIDKVEKEAEEARKQIDRFKKVNEESPIAEVQKSIENKFGADKLQREVAEKEVVKTEVTDKKKQYITSSMSRLSKSERKLVSKLLTIINEVAPKDVAEKIIDKIKEELR